MSGHLYPLLFNAWKESYPGKSHQVCQNETNLFWKNQKEVHKHDSSMFCRTVEKKIEELKKQTTKKKTQMLQYFLSRPETGNSNSIRSDEPSTSETLPEKNNDSTEPVAIEYPPGSQTIVEKNSSLYQMPAQNEKMKQIQILESELNSAILKRDAGLSGENIEQDIEKLKKKLNQAKKSLQSKKRNAEYQRQFRAKRQATLKNILAKEPNLQNELGIRNSSGRPRLEYDQPELLKVLSEIAAFGGGADDRRRSEMIRSCKTLDDLCDELNKSGFQISRTATYLRLLPNKFATTEGKRHIRTVPVKLTKATTDLHKSHPDAKFCTSSIRALESLASILGPDQVFFISQDDKARVPIGKTAVEKQAPFLMHMQYRVRLPDHDWVVAEKHKLIPSVYAGIKIDADGMGKPEAITYSGPTYIAIRSGKHSSSSAKTHGTDFERLLELEEFSSLAYTLNNHVKPIVILSVDGGPDENPRFPCVISQAIQHFKKFDLDAFFIVTNAPGRSCFNRVERRMAPLSHQLSGLILPHDTFGTHLNDNRKTIDDELELRNFASAGNILANIWSSLIIDGEPVVSEYINPIEELDDDTTVFSKDWYCSHVRESQYFLQIVKCNDVGCCGRHRSSLRMFLFEGFFPPPCPIQQGNLVSIPAPNEAQNYHFCPLFVRLSLNPGIFSVHPEFKVMPYDFYCPSVQKSLKERTCNICHRYFASKKNASIHKTMHGEQCARTEKIQPVSILKHRRGKSLCITREKNNEMTVNWYGNEDIDVEGVCNYDSDKFDEPFPVIDSISEWLKSDWSPDT